MPHNGRAAARRKLAVSAAYPLNLVAFMSVSREDWQSQLKEQPMTNVYVSPDLTAFVSTCQVEIWHVGVIEVLLGTSPTRVEEECLALRDTAAQALQDAQRLALAVISAWRDKVKL